MRTGTWSTGLVTAGNPLSLKRVVKRDGSCARESGATFVTVPRIRDPWTARMTGPLPRPTSGTAMSQMTMTVVRTWTTAPTAESVRSAVRVRIRSRSIPPMTVPRAYPRMTPSVTVTTAPMNCPCSDDRRSMTVGTRRTPRYPPPRTPRKDSTAENPPCRHPETIASRATTARATSTIVEPVMDQSSGVSVSGAGAASAP